MAGLRPTERRPGARQHGHLRTGSPPRAGFASGRTRADAGDRLLAPLRRHRGWTLLGLVVAAIAMATRFVAIGILPPSIEMKRFAHADASTQIGVGKSVPSASNEIAYHNLSTRTYALADMLYSPEITAYVARAAGLPASKIGVLGPLWTELWRSQQWASGPQRDRQILIEKDRYQITINQASTLAGDGPGPGPGPPVIDVQTQAPTGAAAARLASAVPAGLNAYLEHLQAATGVPERDRYTVSQIDARDGCSRSDFAACRRRPGHVPCVSSCSGAGPRSPISSLVRGFRATAAGSKVGDRDERSSDNGPLVGEAANATT